MTGDGTKRLTRDKLPPLPAGDWLFKLRGEIFGPVPPSVIVEHMMAGEIDESTQISLEEGQWRSVQQLPEWCPFLYQAKAQLRLKRAKAEAARAVRRRRIRKLTNVAIGIGVLGLVSFVASYLITVYMSSHSDENLTAWAAKHVPLMIAPGFGELTGGSPGRGPRRVAREFDGISIEEILIEDAPALVGIKPVSNKRKRHGRGGERTVGGSSTSTRRGGGGVQTASAGTLSKEEITSKVYARSNLNRLNACLRAEIKRNEDLPERVVLSFSIRYDGTVHNVQLDDVRLQAGPLQRCFEQKLSRLQFRSYQGQVQNVRIPFNWDR